MSPVRLTFSRIIGRARVAFTNALVTPCFLAVAAALFAYNLFSSEGLHQTPGLVWSISIAPLLPFLTVFLGMNTWSDEFRAGRLEELLSVAVKEREFVLGKFMGVWLLTLRDLTFSLVLTALALYFFNSELLLNYPLVGFATGFLALALQAMLWSALIVALSSLTRSAAVAAIVALVLIVLIPRGGWLASLAWMPSGAARLGAMPLDAHIIDLTTGHISIAALAFYVLGTFAALFICTNIIYSRRLVGVGNKSARSSIRGISILTLLAVALAWTLTLRFNAFFELPAFVNTQEKFSARTRHIMSESQGEIRAILFTSRKDPDFRSSARFVRAFARETAALGGAHIVPRYIDPLTDPAAAGRLIGSGVPESSLVLEQGSKRIIVPLERGFGEQVFASALQRITLPPQQRTVYWTTGHGEVSLTDYGKWGLSDIARSIVMAGYRNQPLELSENKPLPTDCALIIVAGARTEFSRLEQSRLEAYLRQGGRLLVLLSSVQGGITGLLPIWGITPKPAPQVSAATLTGTDVLVTDFAEHPIVAPLKNEKLIFDFPIALVPSTRTVQLGGVGASSYTELCRASGVCRAALAEFGGTSREDVVARPARLIVVGDVGFVQNVRLENSVSANRDFFLNCVAYLAGVDALAESSVEANQLIIGLDRVGRVRYVLISALAAPTLLALVFIFMTAARRNRQ